jgi:hypothetical protein
MVFCGEFVVAAWLFAESWLMIFWHGKFATLLRFILV